MTVLKLFLFQTFILISFPCCSLLVHVYLCIGILSAGRGRGVAYFPWMSFVASDFVCLFLHKQICHLDRQEEGTLPPFALNIMVVYFLQQIYPEVLGLLPLPEVFFLPPLFLSSFLLKAICCLQGFFLLFFFCCCFFFGGRHIFLCRSVCFLFCFCFVLGFIASLFIFSCSLFCHSAFYFCFETYFGLETYHLSTLGI